MRRTIGILYLFFLISLPVAAQVDRAPIRGTITDSSGAVINDAEVGLLSSSTGLERHVVTDDAGTYQLPALPIGDYKLTVEKESFKTITVNHVVLYVGQEQTIDARLQIGGVTEEVEVSTTLEPLNRSSAEVGAVVDSGQIREIPLNCRSFATLMMLAPGAINAGGGTAPISARSLRSMQRLQPCLVDGRLLPANNPYRWR